MKGGKTGRWSGAGTGRGREGVGDRGLGKEGRVWTFGGGVGTPSPAVGWGSEFWFLSVARGGRCGEFVVEDGEGGEGGGFSAEDVGSEGDGLDAGGLELGEFVGGEVAFGADPEGDGWREVSVGLEVALDGEAGVEGVRGEAGDEV